MAKDRCLLVLDMLRDFMEPQGKLYCGDDARKIIPRVQELIDEFHSQAEPVIYVCDAHLPDDPEFRLFGEHAVGGSFGAQVIPELGPQPGDLLLAKRHYGAFFETDLDRILKESRIGEVHLSGVCTSICVMETASGLHDRGIDAVVHSDAVADFDPDAHRMALDRMARIYGAWIVERDLAGVR